MVCWYEGGRLCHRSKAVKRGQAGMRYDGPGHSDVKWSADELNWPTRTTGSLFPRTHDAA